MGFLLSFTVEDLESIVVLGLGLMGENALNIAERAIYY